MYPSEYTVYLKGITGKTVKYHSAIHYSTSTQYNTIHTVVLFIVYRCCLLTLWLYTIR